MHFDQQYRTEKAVLYAFSSYDSDGGVVLSSPVEIDVSGWDEGTQEAVLTDGTPITVDAEATVFQVIAVGSVLYRGPKRELPSTPSSLWQVVSYEPTTGPTGKSTQRTIRMVHRTSLPTVA